MIGSIVPRGETEFGGIYLASFINFVQKGSYDNEGSWSWRNFKGAEEGVSDRSCERSQKGESRAKKISA